MQSSNSQSNGPQFKDQVGEVRVHRMEQEQSGEEGPLDATNPEEERPTRRRVFADPPGNYTPTRRSEEDDDILKTAARDVCFKDQVTNHHPREDRVVEAPVTRGKTPPTAQPLDGNLIVVNAVQVHAEDVTLPNSAQQEETKETKGSSLLSEEKAFLLKMMMLALFLNTVLAVGIVVGGFCLSGACGSRNSAVTSLTPEIGKPEPVAPIRTAVPTTILSVTMVPTPSPTEAVIVSNFPVLVPTIPAQAIPISFSPPRPEPVVAGRTPPTSGGGPAGFGPAGFLPPPPLSAPVPLPSPPLGSSAPAPPDDPATSAPAVDDDFLPPTHAPSSLPTTAPTTVPSTTSTNNNRTLLISIGVPLVIVFEIVLIGSLSVVYRRWKAQRLVAASSKTEGTEDASAV